MRNLESGMLILKYDKGLASPDEVEKAIAAVGHDTRNHKADDEVYKDLPDCCHYKRK